MFFLGHGVYRPRIPTEIFPSTLSVRYPVIADGRRSCWSDHLDRILLARATNYRTDYNIEE